MSVIRSVTNPVGSAAASVEVAWIWPWRRSFSTARRQSSEHGLGQAGIVEDRRVVQQ